MIRLNARGWRIAAAVVVIVACGWWWLGSRTGDGGAEWVRVEQDDLVVDVEVEGTLRSEDASSLGPPPLQWIWEYKISMLAEEGAQVTRGEPVVGFDTTELQQRLQQSTAESDEAQKEIERELAQQRLDRGRDELAVEEARGRQRKARLKVDVPGELTAATALRSAMLDLELAEREIAYLENKLESSRLGGDAKLSALRSAKRRADERVVEIQAGIESMTVTAPRDGTVVFASDGSGEKNSVGDSVWQGRKVVEIPNLDRMLGVGQVDEADASSVTVDQPLTLRLDAHPDLEFTGKVAFIWDTVQQKSWRNPAKIVRLEIALDGTDPQRMRPGMRFRGDIEIDRIEDALVLPLDAVFTRPDGPVVFRKSWGGYERVPVSLGRRSATRIEILDGVEAGDRVARTDLDRLRGDG